MANLNKQYLIFIGNKVRDEREKLGMTQEEFGAKAKLHRTYIGMIERGEKNVTIANLKRIAEALGVRVNQLIDF